MTSRTICVGPTRPPGVNRCPEGVGVEFGEKPLQFADDKTPGAQNLAARAALIAMRPLRG